MKGFMHLITLLAIIISIAAIIMTQQSTRIIQEQHAKIMEPISMGEAALRAIDDPRLATDTSEIAEISWKMSWRSDTEELLNVNPKPVDGKYTLRAMSGNLIVELSAEHPAITTVTAYGRQVWPEPQKKPAPPDFYTWDEAVQRGLITYTTAPATLIKVKPPDYPGKIGSTITTATWPSSVIPTSPYWEDDPEKIVPSKNKY